MKFLPLKERGCLYGGGGDTGGADSLFERFVGQCANQRSLSSPSLSQNEEPHAVPQNQRIGFDEVTPYTLNTRTHNNSRSTDGWIGEWTNAYIVGGWMRNILRYVLTVF